MDPRDRSFQTSSITGEIYQIVDGEKVTLGTTTVVDESRVSFDYWHKVQREDKTLPPSPCTLTKVTLSPTLISGNNGLWIFSNYAVTLQPSVTDANMNGARSPKVSTLRINENAAYTQRLLAETNPFRTEFSAPVALKELVDVGLLFKIAAKGFANFVGSNYLNYKFGWVQFVRDLKTLSSITTSIERRIKEIQSLSKHGGIRRQMRLDGKSYESSFSSGLVQSSWGTTVRVNARTRVVCQISGTVRWRFRPGFDAQLSKLEEFNLAVSKAFDLGELDSQTAWNLIPFSWLVDYFVSLDQYFGQWLGEGIIEPYDICIVRRTLGRQYHSNPTSNRPVITTTGKVYRYEYDRDVTSRGVFPAVRAEFLSRDQLLTLAALIASFKR